MNISIETINNNLNSVQFRSKQYVVNYKGYLVNFDDWDKSFTQTLAELDHLKLTKQHWEAINFLREYYREYEVVPTPHLMIRRAGDKINPFRCTTKDIKKLFPLGGCKHACRLAGLPLHYCHAC